MSTVLVRTKITAEEWAAFRKLAIDRRVATSELAADSLRETLRKAAGDPSPGHSVKAKTK